MCVFPSARSLAEVTCKLTSFAKTQDSKYGSREQNVEIVAELHGNVAWCQQRSAKVRVILQCRVDVGQPRIADVDVDVMSSQQTKQRGTNAGSQRRAMSPTLSGMLLQ